MAEVLLGFLYCEESLMVVEVVLGSLRLSELVWSGLSCIGVGSDSAALCPM